MLCIWVGLVYDVCVHFISIKNVNEKTFYYLMLLQSMLPLDNEFHYISLYSLSKVLKRKWIMLLMYITFLCLLIWILCYCSRYYIYVNISHKTLRMHPSSLLTKLKSNKHRILFYFHLFPIFVYAELESKLCS